MIRFILRSSYGNDSVALIQWAHEQGLKDVTVLYSDTGWARKWWKTERVPELEAWAQSLGFATARTASIGMKELVLQKKGWPMRLSQFCTLELKIKPSMAWLEENDPESRAIILVGVRRAESENRKNAPHYRICSANDGGRTVISPLVEMTDADRDELIVRAGITPLAHRSDECKCINAGKDDIRRWDDDDINEIDQIEVEGGFTSKGKPRVMFRPNKKMGATGIRQVREWAHSERGKYISPIPVQEPDEALEEEGAIDCSIGEWCGS